MFRVLPGADPVDGHRLGQMLLLIPVGQLGQLVVGAEDAQDRELGTPETPLLIRPVSWPSIRKM